MIYVIFSRPASWFVTIVQGSKLTHLVGFSSTLVFSVISVLLCYTLPFLLHYNHLMAMDVTEVVTPENRSAKEKVGWVPMSCYLVLGLLGTYFGGAQLCPIVLAATLSKAPTDIQVIAACGAAWCIFAAAVVLLFWRKAAFIRR